MQVRHNSYRTYDHYGDVATRCDGLVGVRKPDLDTLRECSRDGE